MKNTIFLTLAVLLTAHLQAAEFPFFRAGARAAAMGGAFTAAADDSSAITVNPAGLALQEKGLVSLSGNILVYDFYASGLLDARAAGSIVLADMGFSFSYHKAGKRYDSSRCGEGYKVTGAFAYDTGGGLYLGAGANVMIQSGLDGGAAFDAGVIYRPDERLSFGMALKNFIASGNFLILDNRGNVRYTNHPFFINIGFSAAPFENFVMAFDVKNVFEAEYPYTDIDIAADYSYPNDGYYYKRSYHLGAEYFINKNFGVRAGVKGLESEEYIPSGLHESIVYQMSYAASAGIGVKAGRFSFDFTVENDFRKVNNTVNPFRFLLEISGTPGEKIIITEPGEKNGAE